MSVITECLEPRLLDNSVRQGGIWDVLQKKKKKRTKLEAVLKPMSISFREVGVSAKELGESIDNLRKIL